MSLQAIPQHYQPTYNDRAHKSCRNPRNIWHTYGNTSHGHTLWCASGPVFHCCLQGHSQQQYRWHCVRPISSKDKPILDTHLRYPELAGSPLEDVEPPTHLELSYMHNTHYNNIVSLTGELRNDLPELNHEEVHVYSRGVVIFEHNLCIIRMCWAYIKADDTNAWYIRPSNYLAIWKSPLNDTH